MRGCRRSTPRRLRIERHDRPLLPRGQRALARGLSVTPAAFERQLELLLRRGYQGATFHDAVTRPRAGKTVAVTFDDAYLSVLELALPILDRLGVGHRVRRRPTSPARRADVLAGDRPVAGDRARARSCCP